MSLADCALAPLIWRLESLGVQIPKEAHYITDYGERIFRSQGFTRSLTPRREAPPTVIRKNLHQYTVAVAACRP